MVKVLRVQHHHESQAWFRDANRDWRFVPFANSGSIEEVLGETENQNIADLAVMLLNGLEKDKKIIYRQEE